MMHKVMCIVVFGALAVASVLNYGEAQTVHAVGDTIGWAVPSGAAAYSNWASANKFKLGDILVFNFNTGSHDVLEVAKESFDACTTDNAIGTSLTDGPAHVTLNSTGDHYYICTIGNHCKLGQKLAVTVRRGCGGGGANPPPAPSLVPPLPSPPAGSTDSHHSHSSATAVYAALALTVASSIAMAVSIYN